MSVNFKDMAILFSITTIVSLVSLVMGRKRTKSSKSTSPFVWQSVGSAILAASWGLRHGNLKWKLNSLGDSAILLSIVGAVIMIIGGYNSLTHAKVARKSYRLNNGSIHSGITAGPIDAIKGIAAPWYGHPGGGVQYKLSVPFNEAIH